MSERSISRGLLRLGAVTTAAILMFGAANASAQEAGQPALPTETTAPPSSTEPPVETTTPSTPPPSSEPAPTQPTQPSRPVQPTQPTSTPAKPTEIKKADEPKADLKVTATLDKGSYESQETVRATVTITNKSKFAAQRVHHVFHEGLLVDTAQWGDLRQDRPGVRVEAGATHVVTVTGSISQVAGGKVDFKGTVRSDDGDADLMDNYFSATADVTSTRGGAGGFVYADANRNGKADSGEALAGAVVTVYGGSPSGSHQATTGADGRWTLPDIASGHYDAWYALPGGWVVRHTDGAAHTFDVAPGKPADVTAGAVRPLSESLTASLAFGEDTYGVGDTATVTVTLTNKGTYAITGIKAGCNRIGEGNQLNGGAGWGPLANGGVDLAAGETKTITVTETVPDGAKSYGTVQAICDFEPNPTHNTDGPEVSDSAKVPGGFGGFSGTIAQDKNDNRTVDAGEGIGGTKLALLDWDSRTRVALAETNADGVFQFSNVPAGTYDTVILGPWRFNQGNAGFVRIFDGDTSREVTHFVVPGPVGPDLDVTASFDKTSYDIGDEVEVDVTIKNIGTANASARFQPEWSEHLLHYDISQWGDLSPHGRGVNIEPGAVDVVTLKATAERATRGKVELKGRITASGDVDESNNGIDLTANVTHKTGNAVVTVYGDRNENGRFDDGEALKYTSVSIEGGVLQRWFTKPTDAAGKAAFDAIPVGTYKIGIHSSDGWLDASPGQVLEVKADGTTSTEVRAVRPLSDKLPVSIKFDKPAYQAGERVGLTVTMTNKATNPMLVKAYCAGYGWSYEIGNGPEWGDFRWDGPGAVLAAGETKSFHVEQAMPEASPDHGLVLASCSFGTEPGGPHATHVRATTRVPGAVATTSGRVLHGNGHDDVPVGNVPLVLLDPDSGKVAARTTVDEHGNFTFPDLPVGHYTPLVVGPWKVVSWKDGPLFEAVRGSKIPQIVKVIPGPEVTDPGFPEKPTPPGDDKPKPPAGKREALAKTGASVLGLSVAGLLLLLFGFGARAASRRRLT